MSKVFNSANNAHDETIAYDYDSDDELVAEDSTVNANDKAYTYDENGSTETATTGSSDGSQTTTRYAWDLKNRLMSIDANDDEDLNDAGDVQYGYDTDGQRLSQKNGGSSSTTWFINDKVNPSGYPQVLEERTGETIAEAAVTRSYVVGMAVLGQVDAASGTLYLLRDDHGSTRSGLGTTGSVVESYDYQAFGEAFGFDASTAKTIQLRWGCGVRSNEWVLLSRCAVADYVSVCVAG